MHRREFLARFGLTLALPGPLLQACASLRRNPASAAGNAGLLLMPLEGRLVILDLRTLGVSSIEVPNRNPHATLVSPVDPARVLVLDQTESIATVVDIRERKVIRVLEAPAPYCYSGHACFSPDGKRLFLPEFLKTPARTGRIAVLEADTFRRLTDWDSHGRWSHNIALDPGGRTLIVGHRGASTPTDELAIGGRFTFLSAETGELLDQFDPPNPYWFLNHFDLASDGTIVVSTQSFLTLKEEAPSHKVHDLQLITPVMFGKKGEGSWTYALPGEIRERMRHNHTVVVDRERDRALVAHQNGHLVSVWRVSDRSLRKTFEVTTPLGIATALDGASYVIVNQSNDVLVVDAESLEIRRRLSGESLGIRGSGPLHVSITPA